MKYCAKVYTGDPKLGLLTPGELLTDEQIERLGAEKIQELCECGILEALGEPRASSIPAEPQGKAEEPKAADEGTEEPTEESATEEPEEEAEELPELDGTDDLISEAEKEKPAKKTTKSGGRRK